MHSEDSYGSRYGPELDVVAPGVNIPTTAVNNSYNTTFGNTSAAAPQVSALAALLLSVNSNLSWHELRDIIRNTADKVHKNDPYIYTDGRNDEVGYGRINAKRALAPYSHVSVTITGLSFISTPQTITLTANVSNGTPPYSYQWYQEWTCGGGFGPLRPCNSWSPVGTNNSILNSYVSANSAFKVHVTDARGDTITSPLDYVSVGSSSLAAAHDSNSIEQQKNNSIIPSHFVLQPNYPNPFNPTTTIRFGLPERSPVKLVIYNIAGQRVATLVDRAMSAGYHQVQWNGKNRNGQQAASGVYIYRLTAGKQQFVKKMLLVW